MPFIARQEPFVCDNCGTSVDPLPRGSYRNHCPVCLCSKHVDSEGPGDRASACLGIMRPASLDYDGKKGWLIVHVCEKCGKTIPNKTAPDDDITKLAGRKEE